MTRKPDIKKDIIMATISLLARDGADNLSMRKVAQEVTISLGNLQYHFKNKDILIEETVKFYFESCSEEISLTINEYRVNKTLSKQIFIKNLLEMLLINDEKNEQVIMFREILAMSNRNVNLKNSIKKYYSRYQDWLKNILSNYFDNPNEVIIILSPYIEGYTIVHNILPYNKNETIEFLSKILIELD